MIDSALPKGARSAVSCMGRVVPSDQMSVAGTVPASEAQLVGHGAGEGPCAEGSGLASSG
ncbi:MAG: hypothetical protein P8M11_04190 [Planctomycetota bacterium]|nr:hypothetical protein [Planctomycetota bacterium]